MEYKLNLSSSENKDLVSYCNLNDLRISEVVKKSYLEGFNIERYGLLNSDGAKEKEVIKEVIIEKKIEVPVEIIKEVVKVEYVEIEKPIEVVKEVFVDKIIEVVKEVPVEKVVEKIVEIIKEVPVDRVVIKEVVKEVPVEKIVYVTDQQEMNEKIFQKDQEIEEQRQLFSTKLQEKENLFQNEKKELSLKIQQLEEKPPKTIEVIKEIPVEKIVIEEKVVEVIKEVVVEKPVGGDLQPKLEAIQNTLQKIRQENIEKDKKIKEYEKTIEELQRHQEKRAAYLRGSNLDDTLYK